MVMVIVPCADGCDNSAHNKELTVQAAQEHHQEHKDLCPPFCSCSCCSTQITMAHFSYVSFTPPVFIQTFSLLEHPFISSFFSSIWQPPKIS